MTASTTLLPLAAAATKYLVREVGSMVQQGVAFVDLLRTPDTPAADTAAAHAADDPAGALELTSDSQSLRWKTAWQNAHTQTAALHRILIEKFQASGVDLSESVVLMASRDGRILATADHLDRAAIELALEQDPDLTRQLRSLFEQVAGLQQAPGADTAPDTAEIRLVVSKERAVFAAG